MSAPATNGTKDGAKNNVRKMFLPQRFSELRSMASMNAENMETGNMIRPNRKVTHNDDQVLGSSNNIRVQLSTPTKLASLVARL